ncbi:MAG: CvpA family protein [Desulfonauticus sp.]|nr:CvpA family protein [Desulfonauticus sp.]
MNLLDIVFIVITAFFFLRGIYRGLVQEISSLVALFLGFILANKYWQTVVPYVKRFFPSSSWTGIIAYLSVIIGVMIGVYILAALLKHFLNLVSLGWLDRIAGGLLGLLKAVILCSIILMVMTSFLSTNNPTLRQSKLAPYVHKISTQLSIMLPKNIKDNFTQKRTYWEKKWREKLLPHVP